MVERSTADRMVPGSNPGVSLVDLLNRYFLFTTVRIKSFKNTNMYYFII